MIVVAVIVISVIIAIIVVSVLCRQIDHVRVCSKTILFGTVQGCIHHFQDTVYAFIRYFEASGQCFCLSCYGVVGYGCPASICIFLLHFCDNIPVIRIVLCKKDFCDGFAFPTVLLQHCPVIFRCLQFSLLIAYGLIKPEYQIQHAQILTPADLGVTVFFQCQGECCLLRIKFVDGGITFFH